MEIKENILLAPYTTFKIGGPAKYFCVVRDEFDALQAFEFAKKNQLKTFVMGGGSNLLVSDSGFDGLVIKIVNKGIEILSRENNQAVLKVASGEVWDEVVSFAVSNNWWGMENLSHIPGSTGAIAVQNVGAYGQEAAGIIESVLVFNTETHQISSLTNAECGFGYRQSVFNSSAKGKYIIFDIIFRLSALPKPVLSYRDLNLKFNKTSPKISEIRQTIIEIRNKKFPFPQKAKNGNAGSFFKNPILTTEAYTELRSVIEKNFGSQAVTALEAKKFEEQSKFKIPTAFIIELCNLKDLEFGGSAINQNQPLVIINKTGKATAKDVLGLAEKVKAVVLEKTGLSLQFEPELIGF